MAWTGTYAFLRLTGAAKAPPAGLPAGEYYLTHNADPDNHWLEGPSSTSPGELNNFTWLKFRLERNGSNPSIVELEHSECGHPAQCGSGGNP